MRSIQVRRKLATALAAVAGLASTVVVGVGPAEAGCAYSGIIDMSDPLGGGFVQDNVNIRSGPSTKCAVRRTADIRDYAVYYCWVWGSDGMTWTFLYSGGYGWSRDDLLENWGARPRCGG